MTVATNVVKETAKAALKNNWLRAVIVACIYVAMDFSVKFVGSLLTEAFGMFIYFIIYGIGLLFLLLPLFLGVCRYFWRMLLDGMDNPAGIFYYFGSAALYTKSLKLIFSVFIRVLGISLPVILPTALISVISNPDTYEMLGLAIPLWSENLGSILSLLIFIAFILIIFLGTRYYLAPMLFVADENMDVLEAIHMSKVISKNTQMDFIYLAFSFLLWSIASLFSIPLLYTLPYMLTSYLVHCRFAVTDYNLYLKNINPTNVDFFSADI